MAWSQEAWGHVASVVQVAIGTTLVGIFVAVISHQIQTREIEIKEQEQVSKIVSSLIDENIGGQYRAARVYAAITRSDELRKRREAYRDELHGEVLEAEQLKQKTAAELNTTADAKALDQKQAQIQKIDATIVPGVKVPPPDQLPARVYFHIRREEQRVAALAVAKGIDESDEITVPGVQLVETGPDVSELRYFKRADAVQAQVIADSLAARKVMVRTRYIGGYEASDKLRPRHFELWLADDWH